MSKRKIPEEYVSGIAATARGLVLPTSEGGCNSKNPYKSSYGNNGICDVPLWTSVGCKAYEDITRPGCWIQFSSLLLQTKPNYTVFVVVLFNDLEDPANVGFPSAELWTLRDTYVEGQTQSTRKVKRTRLLGPNVRGPFINWAAKWARSLDAQAKELTGYYDEEFKKCIGQ